MAWSEGKSLLFLCSRSVGFPGRSVDRQQLCSSAAASVWVGVCSLVCKCEQTAEPSVVHTYVKESTILIYSTCCFIESAPSVRLWCICPPAASNSPGFTRVFFFSKLLCRWMQPQTCLYEVLTMQGLASGPPLLWQSCLWMFWRNEETTLFLGRRDSSSFTIRLIMRPWILMDDRLHWYSWRGLITVDADVAS